jgi:hypothetical protein
MRFVIPRAPQHAWAPLAPDISAALSPLPPLSVARTLSLSLPARPDAFFSLDIPGNRGLSLPPLCPQKAIRQVHPCLWRFFYPRLCITASALFASLRAWLRVCVNKDSASSGVSYVRGDGCCACLASEALTPTHACSCLDIYMYKLSTTYIDPTPTLYIWMSAAFHRV